MSKYCKECERLTPDHAEDCPLYPDAEPEKLETEKKARLAKRGDFCR